ncbi:hypothetical protein DES53_108126 [Roseimicrobium gellanilyticum]|uniref:Uncharacterized protein n=2 Tax=Roseimicrobium gellanilyticum TaxID=748857 RepID=A0A366HER7_9BACT|nr:hypothetical protein DES53_108126 [Roseimicrobium gellanilyticum]
MPGTQEMLIVLFLAFATIAGNAVFALHYRRVGKPVFKSLFNPRSFPIGDFNAREWMMLVGVFAVSFVLIVLIAKAG